MGFFLKKLGIAALSGIFLAYAVAIPAVPLARAEEEEAGAETADDLRGERAELEAQLAELERQIEEQQGQIQTIGKEKKSLQNEIANLNARAKKITLEIKSIDLNIKKLNQNIIETQSTINRTEQNIEEHKDALKGALRAMHEADSQNTIHVLLANKQLSDFVNALNNISLVQTNLRASLEEIVGLREDLIHQKNELALEKADTENLKYARQSQKSQVELTQKEKDKILAVTKGKESEYQKILKKTQETAAQIRTRIFQLLGGGELSFQQAYDFARLAERATGVRAAMILAVLHRESLFGKNTGRCQYDEIYPSTKKPAMNPSQVPTFLKILAELNFDPHSALTKVSCPNSDGTYGGAMGPAQFIPTTWMNFRDAIAKVTGSNPPNPWNNSDAFVATSLYLKQYGADSKKTADEKRAAATYYCGGSWQRYSCQYYAGKVLESAAKFQKDIDILNAG